MTLFDVIMSRLQIILKAMEKQRSKIHEMLKKVSSANFKPYLASSAEKVNLASLSATKKSGRAPFKRSNKGNCQYLRLNNSRSKGLKYALNKTEYGTPTEKSALFSYISTPNENSNLSTAKLKKEKVSRIVTSKAKEIYPSTEEQTMSDRFVNIQFYFGKKIIGSKKYLSFQKMGLVKKDLMDLLKFQKEVSNYYGFIGLDQVPYNHAVRSVLNDPNKTFETLIARNMTQIIIRPILVEEKPCYKQLQLSDFQLLQFLGSGGFSNVYLAKCEVDQRICALKFIKKSSITSAKKARMLENEKQILFSIDSPHLVDLYYAFETSDFIIFGLEYCSNGNLYTFVQQHRNLGEENVKYIFGQILNGLEYLHDNNILFRDIKLENLLFNEDGDLKITDFGLSKPDIGEDEVTYSYCGSPEYMAPEMLAKCGHSFHVDYYALGIILYELLIGHSPFYAAKKEDIFMAIMHSEPKFPKQPNISKQVKQLIKGLLMKNPSHRIGSLKGIKQIRAHPWLKNHQCLKSELFKFPYQNIKISSKQVANLAQLFTSKTPEKDHKKYFFPKSFVNKKLVDQLQTNTVAFQRKKPKTEHLQKMIKSGSNFRLNRKLK